MIKSALEDSATVLINSLAQQKIASGIKVFNLSAGEPKLPPHDIIVSAAIHALNQGKTFYPPVSGIRELKTAAITWMQEDYAANYAVDECLIVNGGKFGIYLLFQLLLQPDDEVIIPAPYWVSYPAITELFGGKPVIVATNVTQHWKLTPEDLRKACTSKSRILILNNACNPTGALYTKQELAALLQIAKEQQLLVLSDEVYSGLTYDNHIFVSCASFTAHQDHVVVIQSCSKSLAMTGWRVGFVFAAKEIIKSLTSLMSQSTSGVTTISQWAAVSALQERKKIMHWLQTIMQQRRDVLIKALQDCFGVTLAPPASTLYLFVALADLGVTQMDSIYFCEQALEKANVALVPGKAFGQEGYIRFSFGAEVTDIELGVQALANFCYDIKN